MEKYVQNGIAPYEWHKSELYGIHEQHWATTLLQITIMWFFTLFICLYNILAHNSNAMLHTVLLWQYVVSVYTTFQHIPIMQSSTIILLWKNVVWVYTMFLLTNSIQCSTLYFYVKTLYQFIQCFCIKLFCGSPHWLFVEKYCISLCNVFALNCNAMVRIVFWCKNVSICKSFLQINIMLCSTVYFYVKIFYIVPIHTTLMQRKHRLVKFFAYTSFLH